MVVAFEHVCFFALVAAKDFFSLFAKKSFRAFPAGNMDGFNAPRSG
jgi:hypothetical protein